MMMQRIGRQIVASAVLVLVSTSGALAKDPLFAVLLGGNEVASSDGAANAGDENGSGSATLLFTFASADEAEVCFGIVVRGLDQPILAHIHNGAAGTNGGIVVDLTPPTDGASGSSSGCVALDGALARRILANPRRFYVNVHTVLFPNGAIRGQLF